MADGARDVPASRAALFDLREERRFVREGHAVLDNKRMLLAREMVAWLARHAQAMERLEAAWTDALRALAEAAARHGLDELQTYPEAAQGPTRVVLGADSFLGIALVTASPEPPAAAPAAVAANPSPEAHRAGVAFAAVLRAAVDLVAPDVNLRRLLREYQRTERRVRALENVILPELSGLVKRIEDTLEEGDLEDALRTRLSTRQPTHG